jgi:hypothetical protein
MVPTLFFYELVVIALVWLFLLLHSPWPNTRTQRQSAPTPLKSRRQPSREPRPFAGLPHRPHRGLAGGNMRYHPILSIALSRK